jgi:hypothetical protein
MAGEADTRGDRGDAEQPEADQENLPGAAFVEPREILAAAKQHHAAGVAAEQVQLLREDGRCVREVSRIIMKLEDPKHRLKEFNTNEGLPDILSQNI